MEGKGEREGKREKEEEEEGVAGEERGEEGEGVGVWYSHFPVHPDSPQGIVSTNCSGISGFRPWLPNNQQGP